MIKHNRNLNFLVLKWKYEENDFYFSEARFLIVRGTKLNFNVHKIEF